jgi:acetyltransferase-like isoleucine patch superfamily enzyme
VAEGERPVFVHEKGLCESEDVGAGTRIWAFAHVMRGARVGAGCNIGDHAFVESGAVLGDRVTVKNGVQVYEGVHVEDDAFLGPAMVFTNVRVPRAFDENARASFEPTHVGRGASIGANATVVCGVRVGAYALVGAGSVVLDDVPPHALVVGNPARRIGWVCVCGRRLEPALRCGCGRAFRLRRDGEGLEPALTSAR